MDSSSLSRRTFLVDTARVAARLDGSPLTSGFLTACARRRRRPSAPSANLTAAEMRSLRAFAAQILPSDKVFPAPPRPGPADSSTGTRMLRGLPTRCPVPTNPDRSRRSRRARQQPPASARAFAPPSPALTTDRDHAADPSNAVLRGRANARRHRNVRRSLVRRQSPRRGMDDARHRAPSELRGAVRLVRRTSRVAARRGSRMNAAHVLASATRSTS